MPINTIKPIILSNITGLSALFDAKKRLLVDFLSDFRLTHEVNICLYPYSRVFKPVTATADSSLAEDHLLGKSGLYVPHR